MILYIPIAKAHVQGHYRTNPKTKESYWVKDYYDKRQLKEQKPFQVKNKKRVNASEQELTHKKKQLEQELALHDINEAEALASHGSKYKNDKLSGKDYYSGHTLDQVLRNVKIQRDKVKNQIAQIEADLKVVRDKKPKEKQLAPLKQPYEMTLEEFMMPGNVVDLGMRDITLNEFRARNGYKVPLDDHGGFAFPHGANKMDKNRFEKKWEADSANYEKSSNEYNALAKEGKLPKAGGIVKIDKRMLENESFVAKLKVLHNRSVAGAIKEGKITTDKDIAAIPDKIERSREAKKRGLGKWVKDMKEMDSHGNHKGAAETRMNINKEIYRLKLDHDIIYGESDDPEEITYTTASPTYDGFGTKTIETIGKNKDGKDIRKVSTPKRHLDWQRNRYLSGGHFAASEQDWSETSDLLKNPKEESPFNVFDMIMQQGSGSGSDDSLEKQDKFNQGVIDTIKNEIARIQKEHDELAKKEYKENSKVITVGNPDDENSDYAKHSITYINEAKKRNRLKAYREEIKDLNEIIGKIEREPLEDENDRRFKLIVRDLPFMKQFKV